MAKKNGQILERFHVCLKITSDLQSVYVSHAPIRPSALTVHHASSATTIVFCLLPAAITEIWQWDWGQRQDLLAWKQ